jgi:ADP-ribose pyrophosphatase
MYNPWTTTEKKIVYDNKWIQVEENIIIDPSGNDGIYGVVRPKNYAIAVLALDEEYNTWIVGQYRYTTNSYEWELPKGGCPIGEEGPMEAGRRELKEETGITAKTWQRVLVSYLSNCFTDEISFSYVAKHLSFGESNPDGSEMLEVKKIKFDELVDFALNGQISCALSQATIFAVKIMIDRKEI